MEKKSWKKKTKNVKKCKINASQFTRLLHESNNVLGLRCLGLWSALNKFTSHWNNEQILIINYFLDRSRRWRGSTSTGRWYWPCTNTWSPGYRGLACRTTARRRGSWTSTACGRRTGAFTCARWTPTRWSVKSVICRWSVSTLS